MKYHFTENLPTTIPLNYPDGVFTTTNGVEIYYKFLTYSILLNTEEYFLGCQDIDDTIDFLNAAKHKIKENNHQSNSI